jgi:hypothetical protein
MQGLEKEDRLLEHPLLSRDMVSERHFERVDIRGRWNRGGACIRDNTNGISWAGQCRKRQNRPGRASGTRLRLPCCWRGLLHGERPTTSLWSDRP